MTKIRKLGPVVVGCAALGLLWLLMTCTLHVHELLIGLLSSIGAALFLDLVRRKETQRYHLRVADVLSCWRVPWYVVSSMWEILAVLGKDLAGRRAPSLYRVCSFHVEKDDPLLVTRAALATIYTSIAPNFIVIGVDEEKRVMLFHQVKRSEVPRMTKALGAQAENSSPCGLQKGDQQ